MKKDIIQIFGSMVFNDATMRERLDEKTYKALKKTRAEGLRLDIATANAIALQMKNWAIEKGATHFTHWFQPMTGITAEKHDSFITPGRDGKALVEFSGKELIKGEPDASSFPSGGLRCTFEARGYTVWDTTSYAFIKDGSLCIPTAFCSHGGDALDKKTPLLRSIEAISKQALKILKLFPNQKTKRVLPTAGPEQEYFLIDEKLYLARPDLVHTGRTLFGAPPPKGQEMEDYYFSSLKPRVSAFMKELDEELWRLGVYIKTKHSEVAPGQFELAPIYGTTNVATDHNQLAMEMLKTIASRHGLACLLHEKPFARVNGSGKHNNWSLMADNGLNLLEPGDTPHSNAQFLLFLVATIKAADDYQDLIRVSAANAGNDHRLGGHEAPPAIISMFLGEELTAILDAILEETEYLDKGVRHMEIGAGVLPPFPKDSTDRNRTSPLAFTGNKFEFRMPGSSSSVAGPNIVLNTAVAEVLSQFSEELTGAADFNAALAKLIKRVYNAHKRIVFNGNNYSDEWVAEAKRRGLSNLESTSEALPKFNEDKNIDLFVRHGVFSKSEVLSRCEILMDNYCKTINIEALTMIEITKRMIFSASVGYQNKLATLIKAKKDCGIEVLGALEYELIEEIAALSKDMAQKVRELEEALQKAKEIDESAVKDRMIFFRQGVFFKMEELRAIVDKLETMVAKKYWPLPSYAEMLSSAN